VTATLEQPRCGDGSQDEATGAIEWCVATIVVTNGGTTTRLRYTAMFAAEDDEDARRKQMEGIAPPLRAQVAHLSEAVDDKLALAAAAAGTLPALPKVVEGGEDDVQVGDDRDPDRIATWAPRVSTSPATALIGSAPGEVAIGRPAVVKALKAWRSLDLDSVDGIERANGSGPGISFVIAHVVGTYLVKGKPVKVPYRAMFVYGGTSTEAGVKDWFAVAHFSVATR
jgi:hypothetical protein